MVIELLRYGRRCFNVRAAEFKNGEWNKSLPVNASFLEVATERNVVMKSTKVVVYEATLTTSMVRSGNASGRIILVARTGTSLNHKSRSCRCCFQERQAYVVHSFTPQLVMKIPYPSYLVSNIMIKSVSNSF